MKTALIVCSFMLGVLVFGIDSSSVSEVSQTSIVDESVYHPDGIVDRHRRVTCDLLGVNTPWGSLNHAACAAHCWAMGHGYRGGYCDGKGICNCRK